MSILAPNRAPVSRYRPRTRELPPLPPRWDPHRVRAGRRGQVPLWEFVLLSMLLHALAILLFGAPPGGSRDGRAMWGSLDVVIRESFQDASPRLRIERALGLPREEPPTAAAPARPAAAPAARAAETPQPPPAPIAIPRMLDRLEPRIETPEFEVPKPIEAAPPVERPIEVPEVRAAPIAPLAAPSVQRTLAEPPKIEAPPVAPKPIEAIPIDRLQAPRIERQLAEPPKIEAPLEQTVPRIEAAPIERLEAPRVERQLAQPPKIEAPVVQPAQAPAASRREIAPPAAAPAPSASESLPAQPSAPAAAPAPPPAERSPAAPSPRSPAPESRIAPDVLPAESAPPSPFRAPPASPADDAKAARTPLDLDAMRKRAGELTRAGTGNRAAFPFPMPPVEKPKSKMEDAIEKARKPDCRTAYKELGLAAVVPLIANEFGEGTCRW